MWQYSTPPRWQSETGPRVAIRKQGRVWQYSTPPRWQSETGPRVAKHARVSWSCAATHAARGKTQPRGANTCQLWPAPRVAIHAGNQCRVWQYTLAISAACGNARWQSEKGAACGNHAATSAARGWPYARIRNHKVYPPSTLA